MDSLLAADALWTQKQDDFMTSTKDFGFEWTSSSRDSARAAYPIPASSSASAAQEAMTLFGVPVVESIARFDGGLLKEVTTVFYSRGDVGDWNENKFDTPVRATVEALNKATSAKISVRGKDPTSAVTAEGLLWTTEKARYVLEFSKTKEVKTRGIPFRAEFVRLEILPPEKKAGLLASVGTSRRTKFVGPSQLKIDATSGDVWIVNVPMVDQGQKGYCVVASAERVLRYYGVSVDQQELAQAANSSAAEGTSFDAMFGALKKLSARLKVRVREVEKTDLKDILKLMAEYNRAAKKANAPPIPDQGDMIDLGEVYRGMDLGVLKEVRTKSKGDLARFQRAVQSHINEGTPLLWTVILGKVPEPGILQDAGGHMRLIIGYNPQRKIRRCRFPPVTSREEAGSRAGSSHRTRLTSRHASSPTKLPALRRGEDVHVCRFGRQKRAPWR